MNDNNNNKKIFVYLVIGVVVMLIFILLNNTLKKTLDKNNPQNDNKVATESEVDLESNVKVDNDLFVVLEKVRISNDLEITIVADNKTQLCYLIIKDMASNSISVTDYKKTNEEQFTSMSYHSFSLDNYEVIIGDKSDKK